MQKLKVTSKEELRRIIEESPVDADLNYLDVSGITDMSDLFSCTGFNGDISQWDVSNVKTIKRMFVWGHFSQDLSNWKVKPGVKTIGTFLKSKVIKLPPWYKDEELVS